jgi:hypothetical protein
MLQDGPPQRMGELQHRNNWKLPSVVPNELENPGTVEHRA